MARFALTRSASLVGILLGLSVVVFLLEAVVPADPVRAMVGASATPQIVEAKRYELGLDQQPVEAFGADGPRPPSRVGVGAGRLHRCDQHLGALGAEHVVEPVAELRVTIAREAAQTASVFLHAQLCW
jgi:hypothetical protein